MKRYYVVGQTGMVRFDRYSRMKTFLKYEGTFRRVRTSDARRYPQYKLVSNGRRMNPEMVVDSQCLIIGEVDITRHGRYLGINYFSVPHTLYRY